MALYHFSVRHVSRGKGQMVVASAAYISGQRIYDGYYNKIHDYTSKSGVVFTEILTPEYVPERMTDRETLWNEVEHVERNNKAQLAYSFDIALQSELTLEENIRLAKEFCQEQFVVRGMIVDLAVHEGKSDNEEEPDNPHFHVLAPIRPFTEEGIWGNKQRREYILDEDGNRVKDAKGKDMFNAVSTTGWNDKSVVILYKSIFRAAKESKIIDNNPTIYLTAKGGGVPQKDKAALTDEQAARLLDAIQGLPPYVFVMLGLYAGLRREEILALKWDSVYLDVDCPYLTVRRAWHTENNRPVILDELKTKAAHRNIPLPVCLADCLKETKANSQSEYVVPNREGDPLSYTQFKRLWQYIVTRTVKERFYYRYEDGKRVKHTVTPVLGEKAAHNGKVIYSLDFEVTPHQLRHTYITNLIHSSVDPKTVQYLAGHESSKITMDIYAKVKYNRPDELVRTMGGAFAQWDTAQA